MYKIRLLDRSSRLNDIAFAKQQYAIWERTNASISNFLNGLPGPLEALRVVVDFSRLSSTTQQRTALRALYNYLGPDRMTELVLEDYPAYEAYRLLRFTYRACNDPSTAMKIAENIREHLREKLQDYGPIEGDW
jgi:hypothetical protein